jgi:DNA-binding protein HU-beta
MAKRTTHRSRSGKKLYAVRDASGRFEDIQTYERAHGQDVKRGSAAEKKAKAKAAAKKTAKKTTTRKKKAAPRRKKAAAKKK